MNTYRPIALLQSSRGFTLIEMMFVITIIGILSTFAIPKYQGYIEKAREARCIAEIRYLERDIQAYYVANEKYPTTLADLGLSINNMLDPWGNSYQYLLIAGSKWASNKGTGGTYYVRHFDWTVDVVAAAAAPDGMRGFWTGSWFVSEAWAQGNSGNAPGQSGDPGNSGSPPGQSGDPGNSGSPPGQSGDPGNSGNAGGGNAGGGGQGGGNAGGGGQGGGNAGGGGSVKPRKDRFLTPINSDYDLYSMGPDGQSNEPLNVPVSRDDIIRASNGAYVGVAENF